MMPSFFRRIFFRDEVEMFWGEAYDVHEQLQKFMGHNPAIISVTVATSGFHDNSGQFPAPNRETVVVVHYR